MSVSLSGDSRLGNEAAAGLSASQPGEGTASLRMPLKFRLKKSKQQYNVASKSMYVITVELLDNAMLECTLTAESTGRDCMDNVSQRLGLQQPDLFGLRYVSRRSYPKIRWVDLDRPLKKQLDKYAQDTYLYLGVM